MEAMEYEHLLRRIYKVERRGHKHADADIYRELERAEREYKLDKENIEKNTPRISSKRIDDLEYDYNVLSRRIWNNVKEAIEFGIIKYNNEFSESEIKEMNAVLIEPKFISKETIDNAIKICQTIYVNHNIHF